MSALLILATIVAVGVESLRWMRVAQREHYLPSVGRFAIRWWMATSSNRALGALAIALALASAKFPLLSLVVAALVVVAPLGLRLKGRSSGLIWTTRMRITALIAGLFLLLAVGLAFVVGTAVIYSAIMLAWPWIVDLALVVWRPIQTRLDQRWVDKASAGLQRSGARVVAITGSYGKTTTKGYLAHLLDGQASVVASPASFNNRMGLARAVNEHLSAGTGVFIAEMGTYGSGEIRQLCGFIPPTVAVFTALGPVHLERMKTLEKIAEAKQEIFEKADIGVIAIDDPIMARIAEQEAARRPMLTVSVTGADADVIVDPVSGVVRVADAEVGTVDTVQIQPANAGCAVAAMMALGFDVADISDRLATLPTPPHRQVVAEGTGGFFIIDDTFNSNPAGASRAVELLQATGLGRKVVVTPGMVELGSLQAEANREFARHAAEVAGDILIVGATNRAALKAGARATGDVSVHFHNTRDEAVAWVRENLQPGDTVLYENDLPDHYP